MLLAAWLVVDTVSYDPVTVSDSATGAAGRTASSFVAVAYGNVTVLTAAEPGYDTEPVVKEIRDEIGRAAQR